MNPLPIVLRLPKIKRCHPEDIESLYAVGAGGRPVPLAEIGRAERALQDKTVYHKNLRRVVYVFAEMAGRAPAEAILDIQADRAEWPGNPMLDSNGCPIPFRTPAQQAAGRGGGLIRTSKAPDPSPAPFADPSGR